jgi:LmbE family N-acetylglucosaminyl deacetylase
LIQRAIFLSNVNGYATDLDGKRQERWGVRRVLFFSGRNEVRPDVIVDITDQFETKLASVRAHATQIGSQKGALATPLTDPRLFGAIEGRALVAGRRVGVTYGEAFQLLAPVRLDDLRSIIDDPR